jgi:hypothetical protein
MKKLQSCLLLLFLFFLVEVAGAGTGVFIDSGQSLGNLRSLDVALGDLDGDRDLDAFVGNYENENRVWFNDGTGNFTDSGQSMGIKPSPGVALGDVDGDDDLDAVVANWFGFMPSAKVWLNDGSGYLSDSGQNLTLGCYDVALGDVDGDGDLDAFFASDYAANEVWLNNGSGTFTDSGQRLGSSVSYDAALGDLDGDGDLDAVVGNKDADHRVWQNDGSGFFTAGQSISSPPTAEAVALGDLDADGDKDIVLVGGLVPNSYGVVMLNDGIGNFSKANEFFMYDGYSMDLSLADLDGDGDLDMIVVTDGEYSAWHTGANYVWRNDGSGSFSDSGQRLGSSVSQGLALGDLDGDGDPDAFVANDAANKVWLNVSICEGDFDDDGDADGQDVVTQAAGGTGVDLKDFAATFGSPDCLTN